jgi:hypothetical protein
MIANTQRFPHRPRRSAIRNTLDRVLGAQANSWQRRPASSILAAGSPGLYQIV